MIQWDQATVIRDEYEWRLVVKVENGNVYLIPVDTGQEATDFAEACHESPAARDSLSTRFGSRATHLSIWSRRVYRYTYSGPAPSSSEWSYYNAYAFLTSEKPANE